MKSFSKPVLGIIGISFIMLFCTVIYIIYNVPVALHNIDNAYNLQVIEKETGREWKDKITHNIALDAETIWIDNYGKLWDLYRYTIIFIITLSIQNIILYMYICIKGQDRNQKWQEK